MRLLKNILLFHRKLLLPSYLVSIPLGSIFGFTIGQGENIGVSIGFTLLFIIPMMHLFIYELQSKNEYLYYYNLGINKLQLWISTLIFGAINFLIFSII